MSNAGSATSGEEAAIEAFIKCLKKADLGEASANRAERRRLVVLDHGIFGLSRTLWKAVRRVRARRDAVSGESLKLRSSKEPLAAAPEPRLIYFTATHPARSVRLDNIQGATAREGRSSWCLNLCGKDVAAPTGVEASPGRCKTQCPKDATSEADPYTQEHGTPLDLAGLLVCGGMQPHMALQAHCYASRNPSEGVSIGIVLRALMCLGELEEAPLDVWFAIEALSVTRHILAAVLARRPGLAHLMSATRVEVSSKVTLHRAVHVSDSGGRDPLCCQGPAEGAPRAAPEAAPHSVPAILAKLDQANASCVPNFVSVLGRAAPVYPGAGRCALCLAHKMLATDGPLCPPCQEDHAAAPPRLQAVFDVLADWPPA